MKITREEFKELATISGQVWQDFCTYGDYINEDLLDRLMFPYRNFLEKALGLEEWNEAGIDILTDATSPWGNGVPVEWKLEQVNEDEYEWRDIVYTKDLDAIYDKYIVEELDKNESI